MRSSEWQVTELEWNDRRIRPRRRWTVITQVQERICQNPLRTTTWASHVCRTFWRGLGFLQRLLSMRTDPLKDHKGEKMTQVQEFFSVARMAQRPMSSAQKGDFLWSRPSWTRKVTVFRPPTSRGLASAISVGYNGPGDWASGQSLYQWFLIQESRLIPNIM